MTDRQMEYLLLFATQSNKGRCISAAAEEFGVSLPTVSNISGTLERDGLIQKNRGGIVELTPLAKEIIAPKLSQMKRLEEWLEVGLGLPPNQAVREARRMVSSLQNDTVDGIIRYWLCRETGGLPESLNRFFQALTPGIYQAPFQVYKKDRRELSMGDQGFRKPANLVREDGGCFFLLYPVHLQYQGQGKERKRLLTGRLERLWYQCGGSWYEARESQDGGRAISCASVICKEGPDGPSGTVRIRARSTLSIIKMPESEADVVFDLSQLKPLLN